MSEPPNRSVRFADSTVLSAVLESTADGILVISADGRVLSSNERFRQLWAIPEELMATDDDAALLGFVLDQLEDPDAFVRGVAALYETDEEHWTLLSFRDGRVFERFSRPVVWHGDRARLWSFRDITETQRTWRALEYERAKLEAILRMASDGIHILDATGTVILASDSFALMLGYEPAEVVGMNVVQWDAYLDPETIEVALAQHTLTGQIATFETRHRRKDGSVFDVEITGHRILFEGKLLLFYASRDITQRKHAEEQLRIGATAFEGKAGMVVTRPTGEILRVNKAFTEITGFDAADVVGKRPSVLKSGRQSEAFYREMWQSLLTAGSWEGELWNRRKDGAIYPERLSINAIRDEAGQVTHYLGVFSDISEARQAKARIMELAFYDPLTGLPNRRLLQDRLNQAILARNRHKRVGAVLLIDLDDFKTLNDTRGHAAGDSLLIEIANRMRNTLRESDTAARLGGDEFVVLLEAIDGSEAEAARTAETLAEKLRQSIGVPFDLDGMLYYPGCSVGVTLLNAADDNPESLLRNADLALYRAKDTGRNRVCFFNPELQTVVNKRIEMENGLRRALEQNEFILYYQPQVDPAEGLIGVEALIRWRSQDGPLISPASFIPIAEDSGLIVPIGHWILHTACRQIVAWQSDAALCELTVAVNISARQFHYDDLVAAVHEALRATGARPERLKLEITEGLLLEDIEQVIETMNRLRAVGVQFSIDDFGTGYSSLSYLKRLPLQQLKIDQSFVRDIPHDPEDCAIVAAIIAMGNSLGIQVIAEGVETLEQKTFLARHGCHAYQGYFFGKPLPPEALNER